MKRCRGPVALDRLFREQQACAGARHDRSEETPAREVQLRLPISPLPTCAGQPATLESASDWSAS